MKVDVQPSKDANHYESFVGHYNLWFTPYQVLRANVRKMISPIYTCK